MKETDFRKLPPKEQLKALEKFVAIMTRCLDKLEGNMKPTKENKNEQ